MHGRKISSRAEEQSEDEGKRKARSAKFAQYRGLCRHALAQRGTLLMLRASSSSSSSSTVDEAEKKSFKEAWDLNGLLLRQNPDFYTFWNHRREMILVSKAGFAYDEQKKCIVLVAPVQEMVEGQQEEEEEKKLERDPREVTLENVRICESPLFAELAEETRRAMLVEELNLTAECISNRNPKSYGAWHHRTWCINFFMANQDQGMLQGELDLCARLLQADERNFSNYAAWHHRSVILGKMMEETHQTLDKASALESISAKIKGEFELLQNAIYTEPDDQAPWMYQHWLLDRTLHYLGNNSQAIIEGEIESCRDLLDDNPKRKWASLALARLLRLRSGPNDAAEASAIFENLQRIDPLHRGYYASQSQSN